MNLAVWRTFGPLGVPLVVVLSVSTIWTALLLVLNIAPNATANYLMGTGDFDDGSFWLIIDPDIVILTLATTGLTTVLLGYLYVLASIVVQTRRRANETKTLGLVTELSYRVLGKQAVTTWSAITGFRGAHRKFWVRRMQRQSLVGVDRVACSMFEQHTDVRCAVILTATYRTSG